MKYAFLLAKPSVLAGSFIRIGPQPTDPFDFVGLYSASLFSSHQQALLALMRRCAAGGCAISSNLQLVRVEETPGQKIVTAQLLDEDYNGGSYPEPNYYVGSIANVQVTETLRALRVVEVDE